MQYLKPILTLLSNLLFLGVFITGIIWLNAKIDKMNDMWMSANQVVLQNQRIQIKINSAFNQRLEQFTNHVEAMPDSERVQWFVPYDAKIQALLYTPPDGLKNQAEL